MFTQLKDLVPRTVNKMGLRKQFDGAYVCQLFRKWAPKVLGDEHCLEFISPGSYKSGTLVVNVKNSVWGQTVFMHRKQLIEKINQESHSVVVKDLRTKLCY